MTDANESQLMAQASNGDREALGMLLQHYRERLQRIVKFRMDPRLAARLDPGDIVQESFVVATKRFDYYLANQKTSFFLWLRFLTLQKLNEMYRFHLEAKARDQRREVSIHQNQPVNVTTCQIGNFLMADQTSPSQAMMRDEARIQIETALTQMDEMDQEVLALRHFEQLSNAEVATTLGLEESAASKRFVRAIQRLKAIVEEHNV